MRTTSFASTLEDDVITLPMNALFDPYEESGTLLRLSWKREKDKLRRLLAQFKTFAERYKKLFEQAERHRLLAELLRKARFALELRAKAEDAKHELENARVFDSDAKAAVEEAEKEYENYVDETFHPFFKKFRSTRSRRRNRRSDTLSADATRGAPTWRKTPERARALVRLLARRSTRSARLLNAR